MVVDLLAARVRPRRPQFSPGSPLGLSERGPSITGVPGEGCGHFFYESVMGLCFQHRSCQIQAVNCTDPESLSQIPGDTRGAGDLEGALLNVGLW